MNASMQEGRKEGRQEGRKEGRKECYNKTEEERASKAL
jgi:flagellar biosynthesis/type III secretory pathway protein FliH